MKSSEFILIHIEDNRDDADVFQTVLRRSGIDVNIEYFRDGKTGYEFLQNLTISDDAPKMLVILDLNLPRMTGAEILLKLRESSKLEKIPIFVLSGSENPDDEKLCLALGARRFFIKPWDLNGYKEFIQGDLINELKKLCPNFDI